MQIECSEEEVLKLAGVGTEAEEGRAKVRQRESMVEDGVKEGAKWGWSQEQGGRGRSAVSRAEFSSCGRAVSWRSSEQPRWRTELELSGGKSFDDRHGSATLGATPKRVRFLGGGFWFDLRWNYAQCNEAQRQ